MLIRHIQETKRPKGHL